MSAEGVHLTGYLLDYPVPGSCPLLRLLVPYLHRLLLILPRSRLPVHSPAVGGRQGVAAGVRLRYYLQVL